MRIFEKYALSHSIETMSQEIVKFCMPKYKWWISERVKSNNVKSRKNFCEIFEFSPRSKTEDFNINKIKLKLVFVPCLDYIGGSGYCFTFDKEATPKKLKGYKALYPKETERGFEIGIEIRIFVPTNLKVKLVEVKDEIHGVAVHELTHMYQSIKLHKKEINYEDYSSTNTVLHMLNFIPAGLANDFFTLIYICLTKSETSAYLAQSHTKMGTYWHEYLTWFKSKPEERIIEDVKNSLSELKISDEIFLETWVEGEEENESEYYFSELTELDDILNWGYDVINRRKNYLTKKIGKIEYQKKLNQKQKKI